MLLFSACSITLELQLFKKVVSLFLSLSDLYGQSFSLKANELSEFILLMPPAYCYILY